MKRMHISKSSWEALVPDAEHLEQVVRGLESTLCRDGEVITRLTVNGLALTEIDEERLAQTPRSEVQDIDVEISNVTDLITETIESSKLFSGSLKDLSLRLADQLRFEETQETHQKMGTLIEGLQSLVTAGTLIDQVLQTGHDKLPGWEELNQGLALQLRGMEGSYSQRDFVLLADQIEYDLSRILDEYSNTLGKKLDTSTASELP